MFSCNITWKPDNRLLENKMNLPNVDYSVQIHLYMVFQKPLILEGRVGSIFRKRSEGIWMMLAV